MRRVLTYGTFDLLHYGHIRLLKRAKRKTIKKSKRKGRLSYCRIIYR